jgi:hypothetical protein
MKKINLYIVFLGVITSLVFASCASGGGVRGSKKGCGCGVHKGYVGY